MDYIEYNPDEMTLRDRHQTLIGGVGPRPIAFVGSLSEAGVANLAPFSFFNAFGSNPPIVGVSPANRGHDGTRKDTLNNILATREFTISAVTYKMADQMVLASGEFPSDVDEFEIAGFTKLDGVKVAAPAVAESPYILECEFQKHIDLGGENASGNLLLGRVVHIRVDRSILDERNLIDPAKLDSVGRLGMQWYTRASTGLFKLPKLNSISPIGFGALPSQLINSTVLTGAELVKLASIETIPDITAQVEQLRPACASLSEVELHSEIALKIADEQVDEAWALVEIARER